MAVERSELVRSDVLELLNISSDMSDQSLERLLTKFCELNSKIRFASLWRLNQRGESISIYARSKGDYYPQLGDNGEHSQEFLCSTLCESVGQILNSNEFKKCHRRDFSISQSNLYGEFHPKEIVDEYKLDQFVCLPVQAYHAPKLDTPGQLPRFFCLFYCPVGVEASDISELDLQLIGNCIGNMIYNRFNEKRWRLIKRFTEYLSVNHDPEERDFLMELKRCIPCDAVFQLSKRANDVIVSSAKCNKFELNSGDAELIWSEYRESGSDLLSRSTWTKLSSSELRTAIVYQTLNHDDSNRVQILFCNKRSKSPLVSYGRDTFEDDFGFDDIILADAVGEHVRAFTDSRAERRRRDDVTRIIAHEIKQPLIDIRNSIGKYQYDMKKFPLGLTHRRIQESTDLALILAEMNTDFTDEKIRRLAQTRGVTIDVLSELNRLKRALRGLCEDFNFKNDQIDINVANEYKTLGMARSLLATIFINTVSNSIKYSTGIFHSSWCSVKISRIQPSSDVWDESGVHPNERVSGMIITTTDNGMGIPNDKLSEVFEKETRIHPNAVPGLGLGLFHLKRVVSALGGAVWITSKQEGATADIDRVTRVHTVLPEAIIRRMI